MGQDPHGIAHTGVNIADGSSFQHRLAARCKAQRRTHIDDLPHLCLVVAHQLAYCHGCPHSPPGAVGVHGHAEFASNADASADFVTQHQSRQKIPAGETLFFGHGQGCRDHVNAGMSPAELIALIELKKGPCRSVDEGRFGRFCAPCGPYNGCHLPAAMRHHSGGHFLDFLLLGPCTNDGQGVRHHLAGSFNNLARKIFKFAATNEGRQLLEIIRHGVSPCCQISSRVFLSLL